jgi:ubiquinol-cytochrome c reductase iron-sulfur subunit
MADGDAPRASRRDFVLEAAMPLAGAGTALAMWPFLAQLGPSRAMPSAESVDVDLRRIQPGSMRVVRWRGMPVFVRHRTPSRCKRHLPPLSPIYRIGSRATGCCRNALAVDGNRTTEGHTEWPVVTELCTHLGCVLSGPSRG